MSVEISSKAIVAGSIKYGESDLIITFFTRKSGIVKGFARGAVKSRKRFAGCFDPFTLLLLGYRDRHGTGLAGITSADIIDAYLGIREDYGRIEAGAAMLEVTTAFDAPGGEATDVFDLLSDTLKILSGSEDPAALALAYAARLMYLSGYSLPDGPCPKCGYDLPGRPAVFDAGYGLLCHGCCPAGLTVGPAAAAFIRRAGKSDPGIFSRIKTTRGALGTVAAAVSGMATVLSGKRLPALEKLGNLL